MKKKIIIFIFLFLCGGTEIDDQSVTTSNQVNSSNEETLEQFAKGELNISSTEENAFWKFIETQGEWNYYAGIFVDAYLDDDVGIDEFLELGVFSYNELTRVYNTMADSYYSFETEFLIDMFTPAIENYYKKIDGMYLILEGIDTLDVQTEERGILLLSEAGEEGLQIACDLFEDLNSEEIRSLLSKEDLDKLDNLLPLC